MHALTCRVRRSQRIVARVCRRRVMQPDIEMYSFANGTSEPCRRGNWELLGRVAARHEVPLPAALVDGVQQGRPGAAEELLEALYCQITGKK